MVNHCIFEPVNLAVTVVGYNNTPVVPYWTVKNNWGVRWGNLGYI